VPEEFTADELADANRDFIALVRAYRESDKQAVDAILGNAAQTSLRAILGVYMGAFDSLLVRSTLAYGLLSTDEHRWLVSTADDDLINRDEEMNAIILANITQIQTRIITSG
jgi:hypothetical protein